MIVFPHSKINIGLNVYNKRPDGFHDIRSLFYPVPFCDILEVMPSADHSGCSLNITGLELDTSSQNNLVTKAFYLIKNDFEIPGVDAILHKHIPAGAGLGGGSSDAAFMLKVLNKLFRLKISDKRLHIYAAELGSDCSFFLSEGAALVKGRGDDYASVSFSLNGKYIVLVLPNFHVSTSWAFGKIVPRVSQHSLSAGISKPVNEWQSVILNDFETPVFAAHPNLAEIKNLLYDFGAEYASLTGSGASLYGIFSSAPDEKKLQAFPDIYAADYKLFKL